MYSPTVNGCVQYSRILVNLFGRAISATVEASPSGLFLKSSDPRAIASLRVGTPLEVDGKPQEVRLLVSYPGGEPEVWSSPRKMDTKLRVFLVVRPFKDLRR